MALPKLEGAVVITTAWTATISEAAAVATVTIAPAGTYFWTTHTTSTSSLCTTIGAALTANGTLGGTYTMTLDDTADGARGNVTIAIGSGTFALTAFPAGVPAPGTVLGITASATMAATKAGTVQAQYLFLPDCGRAPGLMAPDGDNGAEEADFTLAVSPSGYSRRHYFNTRYADVLGFGFLKGSKAWQTWESTTNESLQRFYDMVFKEGLQFRYHKDRSDDATYVTWVADAPEYKPQPVDPNFVGSASSLWSWSTRVIKHV